MGDQLAAAKTLGEWSRILGTARKELDGKISTELLSKLLKVTDNFEAKSQLRLKTMDSLLDICLSTLMCTLRVMDVDKETTDVINEGISAVNEALGGCQAALSMKHADMVLYPHDFKQLKYQDILLVDLLKICKDFCEQQGKFSKHVMIQYFAT